jgi:hypothetical protein
MFSSGPPKTWCGPQSIGPEVVRRGICGDDTEGVGDLSDDGRRCVHYDADAVIGRAVGRTERPSRTFNQVDGAAGSDIGAVVLDLVGQLAAHDVTGGVGVLRQIGRREVDTRRHAALAIDFDLRIRA